MIVLSFFLPFLRVKMREYLSAAGLLIPFAPQSSSIDAFLIFSDVIKASKRARLRFGPMPSMPSSSDIRAFFALRLLW